MSDHGERLIALGCRMLLEQSACLIALLDEGGGLIEVNAGLRQLLATRPAVHSVYELLEPSSRPRLKQQLLRARAEQRAGPVTLHFTDGPAAIPQSYRCYLISDGPAAVALLAEPIAPLDQQAAEEYMRVTSELAITARNLQKAGHELVQKQIVLEAALAKIEQIARIDELTQLLNRRSILRQLGEELERAGRYAQHVAILLIDIDYFKQINDRYGHPAGDQVLRDCAGLLQRSIRSSDYLGRYGGEEFLCVLPMTDAQRAADLADRLRREVERSDFTVSGTVSFSLTISIGVADLGPAANSSELLIAHADSALYQAKAGGRNRVVAWQP